MITIKNSPQWGLLREVQESPNQTAYFLRLVGPADGAVARRDARRPFRKPKEVPVRSVAGLSVYLTAADLRERYKCSRMLVYRQIKQHHFPKPVKFGNGSGVHRRWLAANVQAYEEERLTKPNRTRTAASRTAHSPQPSHAEEPCPPGPAPVIVRFDLRRIGAGATQRIRGA